MPLVFLDPFKKTYISSVFSLASFLSFIIIAISILLPLFASYATEDFWQRIKEYSEHPIITYTGNYLLLLTQNEQTGGNTTKITTYFDTFEKNLKRKFTDICENQPGGSNCELLKNSLISSSAFDENGDSMNDKIFFKVSYTPESLNVIKQVDIKLMLFMKYGLKDKVKIIFSPMIYLDIPLNFTNNRNKVKFKGDLKLKQKSPIPINSKTNMFYYESHPFKIEFNDNSPFDLLYYYNKYKNFNYTLKFDYEKTEEFSNIDKKIDIDIEMTIPQLQNVLYFESVFESIKTAWKQYFYIFIPIYFILYILLSFVLRNNIFTTTIKSDIK